MKTENTPEGFLRFVSSFLLRCSLFHRIHAIGWFLSPLLKKNTLPYVFSANCLLRGLHNKTDKCITLWLLLYAEHSDMLLCTDGNTGPRGNTHTHSYLFSSMTDLPFPYLFTHTQLFKLCCSAVITFLPIVPLSPCSHFIVSSRAFSPPFLARSLSVVSCLSTENAALLNCHWTTLFSVSAVLFPPCSAPQSPNLFRFLQRFD